MFKIKFVRKETTGKFSLVSVDSSPIGLNGVDRIRKETGIPELKISLMDSAVGYLFLGEVNIPISEAQARCAGHFATQNEVTCKVDAEEGLNFFVEFKVKTNTSTETGEVTMAKIISALNHERLLEAWEDAGFPLEWNFDEEKYEKEGA